MSALKSEDIVFSLKNHIYLCTLMLQFTWGYLSGMSKPTAGKDRQFHFTGTQNIHTQFHLQNCYQ